ncbi:hypothetical protein Lupro_11835 [Lutibacter profundi]|uniref:GIY-YIG domain-containing protein n=1 Tax=Lutibacter profundi TaxID=1622118 RepID=A0A0X8G8D7_9FLAO|nr:hypothetical protein [Lutibacter profundi]AMC11913.1 hypothetical protein Lupro_11835 [Lutibacter profundi]
MKSKVEELHILFNKKRRFTFPFESVESYIPKNGIYVLFEKGEYFKDLDRIVQIGSHTGENQLVPRLKQHFLLENKNRSIFRKNIGRCLLKKSNNQYIDKWELDTTSRIDKEKNLKKLNLDFEKELEKEISEIIQKKISFCVIELNDKRKRLDFVKKMISTFGKSNELIPSENWLGNFSPKEKIFRSGLWQVNNLKGNGFSDNEYKELKELIE